jgi:RNA recognition motif-containing protein
MSFTVFLGNLPAWVTADDIRGWLAAENLVADAIKVIRNPETQESKGFAFIDAPNTEEMNSIIRRFDRAPLEDRLLRANPAQPPKPKGQIRPMAPAGSHGPASHGAGPHGPHGSHGTGAHGHGQVRPTSSGAAPAAQGQATHPASQQPHSEQRPPRRGKRSGGKKPSSGGANSAFAEELAKAL